MSNPTVLVKSYRKGSNPGGFCVYNDERHNFEGYFKYVFGTKIPRKYSHLESKNQPVYEAITFELSRKFGLKTPNFFILTNLKSDVKFEDPQEFSAHEHSNRPYYFVSEKILEPDLPNLDEIGSNIVNRERVYLDGLMIGDILGKRQNYFILPQANNFNVFYLDLGCSFVHAVGGFLYLSNELKNYSRNCDTKKDKCALKGKTVIGADNNSLINLEELVHSFNGLTIPTLNPSSRLPISDLISSEEISEIGSYLVHGLCKNLSNYKEQNLLI